MRVILLVLRGDGVDFSVSWDRLVCFFFIVEGRMELEFWNRNDPIPISIPIKSAGK